MVMNSVLVMLKAIGCEAIGCEAIQKKTVALNFSEVKVKVIHYHPVVIFVIFVHGQNGFCQDKVQQ